MPTVRRPPTSAAPSRSAAVPAAVGLVIVAMAVVTIASWLDRRLLQLLAFDPAGVLRARVAARQLGARAGQPAHAVLRGLHALVARAAARVRLGSASFLLRFFGITLGAGVLATLVAVVYPPASWATSTRGPP